MCIPFVGEESKALAFEIIERGIQTMLITTDGNVLPPEWCGRWYDKTLIESLPGHIDPCGEDGEFHTLVTSTSSFQGHIELAKLEVETGERFSHQRYRAKALPKQI